MSNNSLYKKLASDMKCTRARNTGWHIQAPCQDFLTHPNFLRFITLQPIDQFELIV